jgi:predicted PurR-regulated permease PerM
MPDPSPAPASTVRSHEKRWLRTDVMLLVMATGLVFWLVGEVLLLVFGGLLLAVGLDGLARAVARHSPLSRLWSLALVLVVTLASLAGLALYMATPLLDQFDELWSRATDFVDDLVAWLGQFRWAQQWFGDGNSDQLADAASTVVDHVAKATMLLLGALSSLVVLLAIGLFAAFNPGLYRNGLLKLFPDPYRQRMDRALAAIAHSLRWWFLGQLVSMLLLGVTVSIGLLVIGVDVWLGLGVLTALLTFIPFLGPLIAAVPILLAGFAEGTQVGLIVLVFYLIVQNIEGTIVVPMIQQRAVHVAPALMIATQVLMGVLFGVMGLVLAAPLTVVAMVAVNKLYVEDVLGRQTQS